MRKLILLAAAFCVMTACYAEVQNINKLPQGTFKKSRNGKIIHYDNNGKKIGVYKLNSERYVIRNEKNTKLKRR